MDEEVTVIVPCTGADAKPKGGSDARQEAKSGTATKPRGAPEVPRSDANSGNAARGQDARSANTARTRASRDGQAEEIRSSTKASEQQAKVASSSRPSSDGAKRKEAEKPSAAQVRMVD